MEDAAGFAYSGIASQTGSVSSFADLKELVEAHSAETSKHPIGMELCEVDSAIRGFRFYLQSDFSKTISGKHLAIKAGSETFQSGWKSDQWQQIPTLKDFDRYCTRERLNLRSFEELDRLALNQIRSQFVALFHSKIGRAIGFIPVINSWSRYSTC